MNQMRLVPCWMRCSRTWTMPLQKSLKLDVAFYREIDEYMCSWEQEFGQPHCIKDKVWQMMHSNDTKTMSLDKDFEGPMGKANWVEWIGKKTTRFQAEKEEDEIICAQRPQMESTVTLAAEWFSFREMMVLQGVSVLISAYVRWWQ